MGRTSSPISPFTGTSIATTWLYSPVCSTVLKSPNSRLLLSRPGKCTISCFGGSSLLFPAFLYASIALGVVVAIYLVELRVIGRDERNREVASRVDLNIESRDLVEGVYGCLYVIMGAQWRLVMLITQRDDILDA
jgi:hypothetical protein